MQLPTHELEALTDLGQKLHSITRSLMEDLQPASTPVAVPASNQLFANASPATVYLIQDGQINSELNGKRVVVFEKGDLVGLHRMLNLPAGQLTTTDTVTVLPIEREELINHVNSSDSLQKLWSYYLVALSGWYQLALSQEIRKEFQPSAGFLHFSAGETIIHQGDEADLVYTLLEGSADAYCDGIKVGHILSDEIFGALAVFTGQKRIASVIASTACTVLTVRKEEFIELVEHQPHICIGLIEEMAEKIKQLNHQISNLQEA
ncbi:cyclic nucleotide-binding domain-containing protein [Gilvimarinus agarilyticus]|uniref:Crp/Fnr family transcriptional regulator n=1 Tax=unclassified Gilvimarinus TaxID=2642066 RepID=UPI001C0A406F|nr:MULTISPECIES: cyclic nucleotide-binding domain-containing protein [unclassified Gilvimarinus]MBU2886114.1 cyclic nucleotide-binding domain-containing protein [Gilvimarinus agarilyticus]MDO6570824.1 cyclic nucleotide-binding domain-containing protein [Gilvimarinus sp. 2_MG-2023]MDO6746992.1 cyclic nucleotide-binding domain-containing protein [Gilvimarinus sp. 1_MG-2023]